jgi:Domain of unknown function DUF29
MGVVCSATFPPMPDDLYDRDVLAWSERETDKIRRLARGERVNDVDWLHVAEEIEGVGLSELHSVESFLQSMFVHLLKIKGWPDSESVSHWRGEVVGFQANMRRRFAPSMRQRIELDEIYADALDQLEGQRFDGVAPRPWPEICPLTLDLMLNGKRADLEATLAAA